MVKRIADDVFALGVTAFEAGTGRHPFGGVKRLRRLKPHHARWSQQGFIRLAGVGLNVRRRLSLAKERPDLPAGYLTVIRAGWTILPSSYFGARKTASYTCHSPGLRAAFASGGAWP